MAAISKLILDVKTIFGYFSQPSYVLDNFCFLKGVIVYHQIELQIIFVEN